MNKQEAETDKKIKIDAEIAMERQHWSRKNLALLKEKKSCRQCSILLTTWFNP
jgi:hypothetical protein